MKEASHIVIADEVSIEKAAQRLGIDVKDPRVVRVKWLVDSLTANQWLKPATSSCEDVCVKGEVGTTNFARKRSRTESPLLTPVPTCRLPLIRGLQDGYSSAG